MARPTDGIDGRNSAFAVTSIARMASPLLWAWMLAAPASAGDTPIAFKLSEPAPGVFWHAGRQVGLDSPGHDDIANIGFIVGDKCVAVIDTGGSVTTGRALREAISKRTSLPICYIINTHVHVDHVLGNVVFKSDHPTYIGSTHLVEAMARSRDFFVREYGSDLDPPPSAAQIVAPDRLVEHDLRLDLGHRTLELRAWPTAHTDCDLTVYDDQSRTLWTGDLLFRERLPAVDGSIKGWLSVLDQLERLRVDLVIPGHGPMAHDLGAAIAPERRYLEALAQQVRAELKQGKSLQDALQQVDGAERSQWLLWDEVHPHNVARVYEELEWE
jgi:quinoprotein relay system zinc metallohydrolase 2